MKRLSLLSILIVLFTSCATSFVTTSWKNPDAVPKKYNKILVLAIINGPESKASEAMEAYLVDGLKGLGYNAVSAIGQYGNDAFCRIREEETLKQLYPYDAVITIVLVDKLSERYYYPVSGSPDFFWEYYSDMYGHIHAPGYYTATKYYWESNLYQLNNWLLLYSAQSQTFEPPCTKSLAREYGGMILQDMAKKNVLQKTDSVLKAF
jgi:hypothetical protein